MPTMERVIFVQAARRRSRNDAPTEQIEVEVVEDVLETGDPALDEPAPPRLGTLWAAIVAARSPFPIYAGLALIAVGFALTAYTWSRVAGIVAVPLQIPYIASGGLTAIGLVVVGAMLISMGAARRDAARREARLDELLVVLESIAHSIDHDDGTETR